MGANASRIGMLIGMNTTQIAVRLPDELLARLDELIERGEAESRAAAVRAALDHLVAASESRLVGRRIAAGYARHPVGEPDDWGALDAALDWGTAAALRELERQERDAGVGEW
jgi:Arc/MetJ-type ribon-helix-helix transcriptional regulator